MASGYSLVGLSLQAVSKTAANNGYTVESTVGMVFWDATNGVSAMVLPSPVGAGGRQVTVKRTDTSNNTLTLTTPAGQIEGTDSLVLAGGLPRATVTLASDNLNWWRV